MKSGTDFVSTLAIAAALAVLCSPLAGSMLRGAAGPFDVWTGISEVGFPAAAFVMLWLMMRSQLRDNTRALQDLIQTIQDLKAYLTHLNGGKGEKA